MSSPPVDPNPADTTVWLVEDNSTFRRTVALVIEAIEGLRCEAGFASCEEALAALRTQTAPQVILLDVGLPGMSGIEGIRAIKSLAPETHVLILTVFDDEDKVFQAICAGASGYLLKTSPVGEITSGINEVMRGGAPMNGRIARKVLAMFSKLAPPPSRDYGLTAREREILQLMVEGLIKKEIASRLEISFHTVDTHLRNIYEKLQVNTQTSAVAKALREGLVPDQPR
jgi:DNA-binding NarL/FixJ family response regulator